MGDLIGFIISIVLYLVNIAFVLLLAGFIASLPMQLLGDNFLSAVIGLVIFIGLGYYLFKLIEW